MQQYRTPTLWMLLITVLVIGGCSKSPDQRLTELAESSLEQQSRQNEAAAENNRQIAETARELVQADANAREQLLRSNREQQAEIQQSYDRLDQARDDLERERQAIAAQRQRDPVVAEAIRFLGLLLAALFPLGVAGYLLYVLHRAGPDEAAVSELLIAEITEDEPLLLRSAPPRIRARDESDPINSP